MRFRVKLTGGTTEAIAIASIDLKSRSVSAKRLRACTPHSSTVRARAVVRRRCARGFAPSNGASEVLVLPMWMTKSRSGPIRFDDSTFSTSPGVHAWVHGTASVILEPHLWGFDDLPRRERARSQSLLKEAGEHIIFSSPGVNAWAREKVDATANATSSPSTQSHHQRVRLEFYRPRFLPAGRHRFQARASCPRSYHLPTRRALVCQKQRKKLRTIRGLCALRPGDSEALHIARS